MKSGLLIALASAVVIGALCFVPGSYRRSVPLLEQDSGNSSRGRQMAKEYGRRLSRKQAEDLIKEPGSMTMSQAPLPLSPLERAYQLSDGRVVILYEDEQTSYGTIYSSKESLQQLWQQLEKEAEEYRRNPGKDIKERFPQGTDFLVYAPKLIDELAQKLKLRREELDFSDESMKKVHIAALKLYEPEERMGPELLPALFAYVGEALVRRGGWKWKMELYEDTDAWMPLVIRPNGEVHSAFSLLSDCFYENMYGPGTFTIQGYLSPPTFRPNHWIEAMGRSRATPREVQQLIKQPGCKENPQLAGFDSVIEKGYDLPDGSLLLVYRDGRGAVWESIQRLREVRDTMIGAMIHPKHAPSSADR